MSMVCSVCGEIVIATCRACHERYREDVRTGHIPPKFVEAEDVEFSYFDWASVKEIERRCAVRHLSPEESRKQVDDICIARIAAHRRLATPETPEQRKKRIDDELKKNSTY